MQPGRTEHSPLHCQHELVVALPNPTSADNQVRHQEEQLVRRWVVAGDTGDYACGSTRTTAGFQISISISYMLTP